MVVRKLAARRRICWPEPDGLCMQGGCIYCNFGAFRSVNIIRGYAARTEKDPQDRITVNTKGRVLTTLLEDFEYGEREQTSNIDREPGGG
jgi:hypothetical protein